MVTRTSLHLVRVIFVADESHFHRQIGLIKLSQNTFDGLVFLANRRLNVKFLISNEIKYVT